MDRDESSIGESAAPILRWAGSKRKLLPRLLPLWERSNSSRYIEPFVGSAALFLAAAPDCAILADSNEELIATYRTIRSDPDGVFKATQSLPRDRDTFLALRSEDLATMGEVARAARFVFLNRHCFNGLYRTNNRGVFNVPYAPTGAGALPSLLSIRQVAGLLRRAELYVGDFEAIVRSEVAPGDFVYLDPPYAVENRRIFRQYSATTFGVDDLHRLAALLYAIDAIGATFVLSYAVCSEALAAFGDWPQVRVSTQRNIAGFAAHRRRSMELLVTNRDQIIKRT